MPGGRGQPFLQPDLLAASAFHGGQQTFQGGALHIRTNQFFPAKLVQAAGIRRLQPVYHPPLGGHDHVVPAAADILDDGGGRSRHIRQRQGLRRTLGMHGDSGRGIQPPGRLHIGGGDGVMNRTISVPGDDMLLRHLTPDIIPQVFIRNKQDILLRQGADDFQRRRGSDANVADRLQLRRGVDIGYHRIFRMSVAEFRHPVGIDLPGHGAVRLRLHQHHPFIRGQDFHPLRHEPDAAHIHGPGLAVGSLFCQRIAVPYNVRRILDLRCLIGVGGNQRLLFLLSLIHI